MAERVDVCIVGSGFGGSISAYRLAELYRAAGQTPERARAGARPPPRAHRLPPVDGPRAPRRDLRPRPGPGRADRDRRRRRRRLEPLPRRVAARPAARPSSAATAIPTTARRGACGRARSAARRSTPTTRAPRRRCGCSARPGSRSRSPAGCGPRRSTARATPATAFRWRSTSNRCIQAKWCHTGCIFAAKNSVITNYLAVGGADSASRCGPSSQVELIVPSAARPYRYVVNVSEIDNDGDDPTRQPTGSDVPDRVQGADPGGGRDGQLAAADALAPGASRASRRRSASTSASTATTSRRSSTTSRRCGTCSGCPATARSTRATTSRR